MMEQEDWRQECSKYIQRLRATRPSMPITAQVGFFMGTVVDTTAGLLGAIPGMADIRDGYRLGTMNSLAKRAERMAMRGAEQAQKDATLQKVIDTAHGINCDQPFPPAAAPAMG